MSAEQILNELKEKRLPTFGTGGERRDRLKKHFGIEADSGASQPNQQVQL